jgi:translocation and assembly module TamB
MELAGDISFGGSSGPVFNLTQKSFKAQAVALDTADVALDSDLKLTGPLDNMLLAGTITVDTANIGIPERLPPSVTVVNYRVKGTPPPELDETGAAANSGPSVHLKLALDAPNRVFVRGRGLDVELGGQIDIRGTANKPEMNGAFKLQRGTLDLFGQTYNFTSGTITFEPDSLEPTLNLVASLKATDATVTITVAGKPSLPSITLSSSPTLSQDEILARLVFGKPLSDLNGYESVQLARSAATLAGFGGGTDIVGSLRQTFGLDRLNVSGTGGDDLSLDAGRYINDRVYLGVEQGLAEDSTGAKVEIKLTDTLSAESSVNATSGATVGLTFEMDY